MPPAAREILMSNVPDVVSGFVQVLTLCAFVPRIWMLMGRPAERADETRGAQRTRLKIDSAAGVGRREVVVVVGREGCQCVRQSSGDRGRGSTSGSAPPRLTYRHLILTTAPSARVGLLLLLLQGLEPPVVYHLLVVPPPPTTSFAAQDS